MWCCFFFFQAEDGIRDLVRSRGLGDVYKRQIVLLVKHTEFSKFKPLEVAKKTSARIVIDTVNAWNKEAWEKAGFTLFRLGNNKSKIGNRK